MKKHNIMKKSITNREIPLYKLILILALIFILLTILFLLINPEQLMRNRRNNIRTEDIQKIHIAIDEYELENSKIYPEIAKINIGSIHVIGLCTEKGETGCTAKTTHEKCIDLSGLMEKVPKDPFSGTDLKTDYYLRKNEDGTITIGACDSE